MKIDKHNFNTTKWFKIIGGRAVCRYYTMRYLARCAKAEGK